MDALLFAALVALTVLSPRLIPAGAAGSALTVQTEGGVVEVSLLEDGVYPVPGPLGEAHLVVAGGRARLENAPCPLKLCEAMGPVSRAGQVIVCLPNRIAVTVQGLGEVDAVSR